MSSILFKAPNGNIIIYGGATPSVVQVTPDLFVLNTDTFEFTEPKVSTNIGKVPPLVSHTANLVGNYMIIAFGK